MTEKNGIVTFECDKDSKDKEILNSTQRNNGIVFPDPKTYPNAQYIVNWKNTCNCTSYAMMLEYSGAMFPPGKYSQPEDNLCYFILTDNRILEDYKKSQPVLYNAWMKTFTGTATKQDLENAYPPNELHAYLSKGANLWLGYEATAFNTNVNFKKALWHYMVEDNLPMAISTNFGGAGHIVCVTGVQYKKADYEALNFAKLSKSKNFDELINTVNPVAIIVDDPWGNASSTNFEKYPTGGGGSGNDIVVPWDIVVKKVKPLNSPVKKWCHYINKRGMATV